VGFIQVSFIVSLAVESIGVVKIEHHQDGKGAERHKIVKEFIATKIIRGPGTVHRL
jgi:hypothetical protein